jgi:hypothetical protein
MKLNGILLRSGLQLVHIPKLQVVSSSSMGLSLRFTNLGTMTSMGHGSMNIKRCII